MSPVAAAAGSSFHGSLLGMILGAGLMVQFVLVLLLVFSVVSWAIIFMKYRQFRKVKRDNEAFLEAYGRSNRLSEVYPVAKNHADSTLAGVFMSGYEELSRVGRMSSDSPGSEASSVSIERRGVDHVERALSQALGMEGAKLEGAIGFLATTGSASPFIGLFGTVWGIMDTFKGIGARGSATLAVVAPGISEALIATAAGLAAAIPAVIFYNYYVNRVHGMTQDMEHFASEFLNLVDRHSGRS
ncbi:MAG: protein TolQ [Syntrophaceae bacterium]|nr:protein TolQ [Syntrophaceae bacterium]